jgi:hypothetical protein
VKLVHLVGFIIKKFVTMHGHMNVKKNTTTTFINGRSVLVMTSILQNLCSIYIVEHTALSEARDVELW